jgi:hypothetical protein
LIISYLEILKEKKEIENHHLIPKYKKDLFLVQPPFFVQIYRGFESDTQFITPTNSFFIKKKGDN